MDYNQRSRGQKSGAGHPARAPRRPISSAAPINRSAAASPRGKTAPAKISPTMAAAPARSSRSTRKKAATRPARPAASAA